MFISKFCIKNYKSFSDSGEVVLKPGINIITGQNNAGKTAMLQALSTHFISHPHRTTESLPTQLSSVSDTSQVYMDLVINRKELETYLNRHPQIYIPATSKINDADKISGKVFFESFLLEKNVFRCTFFNGSLNHATLESLGEELRNGQTHVYNHDVNSKTLTSPTTHMGGTNNTFLGIAHQIIKRIYCFRAERFKIGHCKFGPRADLNSDASNLPEVLGVLQHNPILFNKYNAFVSLIFPKIFHISVKPSAQHSNDLQICVWNEDPKKERAELAVPLDECGTGLSQVLAILYVVLTSTIPQVIIIDEPNSFLHPGAARKLIEILNQHPQHQFIIATHSASTIASSNPKMSLPPFSYSVKIENHSFKVVL